MTKTSLRVPPWRIYDKAWRINNELRVDVRRFSENPHDGAPRHFVDWGVAYQR